MNTSINLFKKNKSNIRVFLKCLMVDIDTDTIISFYNNHSLLRPYFSDIMEKYGADDMEICIPATVCGGAVSKFVKTYEDKRGSHGKRRKKKIC